MHPGSGSATVAVVTGAARGVGRGIALVLGDVGVTVYVTDRESRRQRYTELPGTVEDTAEQVTERGGVVPDARVEPPRRRRRGAGDSGGSAHAPADARG